MTREGRNHVHAEYWRRDAQYRFEDRMASELAELNEQIAKLTNRITAIMAGVVVISFLLSILLPFLRSWIGAPA